MPMWIFHEAEEASGFRVSSRGHMLGMVLRMDTTTLVKTLFLSPPESPLCSPAVPASGGSYRNFWDLAEGKLGWEYAILTVI